MKENEKIWVVKDGYIVLRNGTVFRLNWNNTGKCVEVKQSVNNCGYLQFSCNGITTVSHRFIAECFIPNPNNFPEINHKNEIKSDNRVDNLEWCDRSYNINYGTRNKKIAKAHEGHTTWKKGKKVFQFTKDGEFVKEWCSLHEIQRQLGFSATHISKCCLGRYKFAYDFIWRYK